MRRTAPGLLCVLVTLLAVPSAAPAAAAGPRCNPTKRCDARPAKKQKHGTGWHNGTYDGGPGDPIIAPLKS